MRPNEHPDYKSLRDYTHEELKFFLDNNQTTDLTFLIGICSEVLRRIVEEKLNEN